MSNERSNPHEPGVDGRHEHGTGAPAEAPLRSEVEAVGVERGRSPSGTQTASTSSVPVFAPSPHGFVGRHAASADELPDEADGEEGHDPDLPPADTLPLAGRTKRRGRHLAKLAVPTPPTMTPEQRLLILDTWQRSGLPAGDFASLVGVSKHTLHAWKKKFAESGPAGLMDQPKGAPAGSRLPELTRRTILMLKQANPEFGCQRISDLLVRGPALPASPAAVAKVLHEAGYQMEEVPTRPHPDTVRRFERAQPNQLWQTDLFTFILKRQNRRVYLVAFMDDHSRFIVGYGLHASQSSALVMEVLRASLMGFGVPQEILTDNGSQYVTWRGKSAFTRELEKQGIKQVVAAPRRPQTLGKIERFWGTLWRDCVERAVFVDLGDARARIGHFIDHYNFQRPHQGIEGLVPADRFFGAASEVKRTLTARVQANALELARHGAAKSPFYLTGQAGGRAFSVHAEGERVILTRGDAREEIDLTASRTTGDAQTGIDPTSSPAIVNAQAVVDLTSERAMEPLPEPVCPQGVVTAAGAGFEEPVASGESPLDDGLEQLRDTFEASEGGDA